MAENSRPVTLRELTTVEWRDFQGIENLAARISDVVIDGMRGVIICEGPELTIIYGDDLLILGRSFDSEEACQKFATENLLTDMTVDMTAELGLTEL